MTDTATVSPTDHYQSEFTSVEKALPGYDQSWASTIRKSALARFQELGFPTIRHEGWRHTSVKPIAEIAFRNVPANGAAGPTAAQIEAGTFPGLKGPRIVFVNGAFSKALSSLDNLPKGVSITSLAAAFRSEPDRLKADLARHAPFDDATFVALNTAFLADGCVLRVDDGVVVEDVVHIVFASDGAGTTDAMWHPRNLVVAGRNSQLRFAESYLGLSDEAVYFTNAVTEVVLGENAVVTRYKLQRESRKAFHMSTLHSTQARSANFHAHGWDLGGGLTRNDIRAVLDGEGGECNLDGLYLLDGRQHVDNHTFIEHVKPHCNSREVYRGVLDDHARAVFCGRIIVHQAAQKTDSKQSNNNLLLSEDALVNTMPQLEIYADDVKCTHGATIGRPDKDAIFYLRSRGIGAEEALRMLTRAFVGEVIDRVGDAAIRESLEGHALRILAR